MADVVNAIETQLRNIETRTGVNPLRNSPHSSVTQNGPPTKTRVEVGLNMKNIDTTNRLVALQPGGMCQYKVNVTHVDEVDEELVTWIRIAFDSAG